VVGIRGELDLASGGRLKQEVDRVLWEAPERLVFDLSDCGFIDTTGVSLMVRAQRGGAENGSRVLVVARPGGDVRRTLELTGLAASVSVFDSVQAAVGGRREFQPDP